MVNSNRFILERMKDLLWIVFIAGMVAGIGRFAVGLGAATNMLDLLPWGLWKVFNMVAGAALATSGFVIASVIYIFQLEKFKPVARFSILIGFLGYGSSLVALLFDIGLPHRGWHPFVMWNPHSFLFEVFWCVSVYWSVTAFELIPLITERFPFPKVTHFLHEIMLPVVILGITLSTMHHSSLGSLFMLSPTRLHPLWFSTWIPPEFFISAMGAGLSVIVLLMIFVSFLYRREQSVSLYSSLVKGSAALLAIYLVLKIVDFTYHGKWNFVFGPDFTWESALFWVEIALQVIVPIILFSIPATRNRMISLVIGTSSAAIGLILHRINTGIIGYFRTAETVYVPNLSEFLLTFGVLSGAALLFLLGVERLYIFNEPKTEPDAHHPKVKFWTKDEALKVFAGRRTVKAIITAVIVIPVTLVALSNQATGPYQPVSQPVSDAIIGNNPLRSSLRLDGNLNGDFVDFPHWQHQQAFAKEYGVATEETCQECHHLNMPNDYSTNCRVCHQDMLLDVAMFDAENHKSRFESEAEWRMVAQMEPIQRKVIYDTCMSCHEDNMLGLEQYAIKGFSHQAPGYQHAMHGSCQTCHRQRQKDITKATDEGNCLFCHRLEQISKTIASVSD